MQHFKGTLPSTAKACRPCAAVGKKRNITTRPPFTNLRRSRAITLDLLVAPTLLCLLHPKGPRARKQKGRLTTRSAKLLRCLVTMTLPGRRIPGRNPLVDIFRSLETERRRPKMLMFMRRLLRHYRRTMLVGGVEMLPQCLAKWSGSQIHGLMTRMMFLFGVSGCPHTLVLDSSIAGESR